nr:RNA-directed DNA polymerase, eukaryota [Tanacetum cinerariifolium]
MRRLEAMGTYTDDEINRLARGGKQRWHIAGVGRVLPARATASPNMFSQFESGGASRSGGCEDEEEGADHQDDEDEDGDGDGDTYVLGVGVSDVDVYQMANIIGCGVSKFPFKYLGVPVGCNMKRCVYWNAVIQKFESKLSSWKARLLSAGGRLSLIKAVLGNLPTYFMSLYMMPTSICSKMESLRNNFFRGAGHNESKIRTPRGGAELSQFEALTALIGSVQLSDSCDSWQWHPNYTVGYTVASARALVDESILETDLVATR